MILKVDTDLDNPVFNISDMKFVTSHRDPNTMVEQTEEVYTMMIDVNLREVKYVYTEHEYYGTEPLYTVIELEGDKKIKISHNHHFDSMHYPEKLITAINRDRLLETTWAEENPQKYI